MRVERPKFYSRDGRLKSLEEPWFFYAAMFVDLPSHAYAKLGISTVPYSRAMTLLTGCPFTFEVILFDRVGSRSAAASLEVACARLLADRSTRGEWYRFTFQEPGEKQRFHGALNTAFLDVVGRPPKWNKASRAQMLHFAGGIGHKGEREGGWQVSG